MKIVQFILAFSLLSLSSFGQTSIKGKVTDGTKTLPSATVLLLQENDSALVKGVVADITGEFDIPNIAQGHYMVSVSMVGYNRSVSPSIKVGDKDVVLPDIILEGTTTELVEVVVKAEKPMFEQQIDRLVINVQSSITSSGNTALEVLQKSPGVVVNRQNNSISVNGKSGVRVMINGKIMQLPLDVVVPMLDGMSASNIDKIELITTPPSRYDAEGNAGIIHIVTNESTDYGTNGSFGLTLGYKWAETYGGNFSISHRGKKFAWLLDYSAIRTHNLHIMELDRQSHESGFTQVVRDYSHRENVTNQQNINAGAEWKINKNTSLNLLFTGYKRNWILNATTNDVNRMAVDSTVVTNMNIYEANIWQSGTGAVAFQTKPNSKTDLSLNLDYLYYHNSNPSAYDNTALYEQANFQEKSKIDLTKNTPIRILIAQTNYRYVHSSSLTLEAGVKGVTSKLDNDIDVRRLENNIWIMDTVFSSFSTLHEQIGGAYVFANWKFAKQWQLNSGLRYEYTHTSISTPAQKDLTDRKYGYFFPGLVLRKDMDNEKDLQFSYSRRITRPTYNDIAPFVFFWGPNTFSSGNTSLWSSLSETIRLGYHDRQWIISLQFTHAKKEIINLFQPEKDSVSNRLIFRSQNLNYLNTLALTNTWSFSITPWWEVQSNLTVQYQVAKTEHLANNVTLNLYGLNLNMTHTIKLPKDMAVEVSGFYQSKSFFGVSAFLPYGSLNVGIQKKFGNAGTLKLSVDDILYTNTWRIRTWLPENDLDSNIYYDWHNQFIRLAYSMNIGNSGLRSVKIRSGSSEEQGRVTN